MPHGRAPRALSCGARATIPQRKGFPRIPLKRTLILSVIFLPLIALPFSLIGSRAQTPAGAISGKYYKFDVAAQPGMAGGRIVDLLHPPSINDSGVLAFKAEGPPLPAPNNSGATNSAGLYLSRPTGGLQEILYTSFREGPTVPVTNSNRLAKWESRLASGDVDPTLPNSLIEFLNPDQAWVARDNTSLSSQDFGHLYPDAIGMSNTDQAVFSARTAGVDYLAAGVSPNIKSVAIAGASNSLRPMIADNNRVVVRAGANAADPINLGDNILASPYPTGVTSDDMAKWAVPQFESRGQIDRAGRALVENHQSPIERASALSIINNWRAIHSYPLHIAKVNLKRRAEKVDGRSIIAQRLKRLSSISLKLRRNSHMKLTQMQDIGGCRAILPTIKEVRRLIEVYETAIAKNPPEKEKKTQPTKKQAQIRPEFVERYDYISRPKPDGYRSHHYVFKYRSAAEDKQIYNGLRVEIQIRSKLQHAWATAVEAISTFTEQALKSGIGDARWKRFFALMGSAISLREGCPTVPDTPTDKSELVAEIRELYHELQVDLVLYGITATVDTVRDEPNAQAHLLLLDAERRLLQVKSYRANELANASEEYLLIEQQYADNPRVQAVLVSVDSLASLQSAYPNYYLDTGEFLKAVRQVIGDDRVKARDEKDTRRTATA